MKIQSNLKVFCKNFSYTIFSNLISIIITLIITLIVPKLINVEEYGYWQLYLFYLNYVGLFHLGWCDGIYLKYGGYKYHKLDKRLLKTQFVMFGLEQFITVLVLFIVAYLTIGDGQKQVIIYLVAINLIFTNVKTYFQYILQVTNRIKENMAVTIIYRFSAVIIFTALLLVGSRNYVLMLYTDVLGCLISLILSMYYCRDIVIQKVTLYDFSIKEIWSNISVGSKLMIANLASNLIIGVIRVGIEDAWDVASFGKVSLTLSISNFMMLFINAIGIVLYPTLRRIKLDKLAQIYKVLRDLLMLMMFYALIVYFPLRPILSVWLPKYTDSLKYMALVFPICVYEGKMSLLTNTYMKTLREEKMMMKLNVIALSFSVLLTIFATRIIHNLDLAVLSIIIVLTFKCIISELYLVHKIHITISKDIVLELIMTSGFIICGWFLFSVNGLLMYSLFLVFYTMATHKNIKEAITYLKSISKDWEWSNDSYPT